MFDLSSFYANAKYLTPEQRNDASANGFFNAATQFLAPQPQGASPLYTLAKGLSGYTQGVADYGNSIPTQDKAWQDYETRKQLQSFYTPEKLQQIGDKYGIQSQLTPEQAQKLDMEVASKNATRDPMDDKLKAAQINAYNASASQKGASNAGGATGELVDRYMRATGASFPEALQAIQTGYRQNMLLGPDGAVAPIPGAANAVAGLAAAKKSGELGATAGADIDKSLADITDVGDSLVRMRQAIAQTDMTGPVAGRIGDMIKDPSRTDLVSAQNEFTLRAKSLLNMPSNNFSDADRNFLQEIAGGRFARNEGLNKVADRMSRMVESQKAHLLERKSSLGGFALTGVAGIGGGQSQQQAPAAIRRWNPQTGKIE